jgi:hypothetical protein
MKYISLIAKIIGLLILAGVIVYVAYTYIIKPNNVTAQIDSKPISYVYLWNDETFKKAEQLTIEGRYDEALDAYNTLLQGDLSKEDVITKSQLNIRVATLLDLMGEKEQAIIALNQIASNEREYFITRSFAYEYMARMLYDTRDPIVLKAINESLGMSSTAQDKYAGTAIDLLKKSEMIAPLYLALTQQMKVELQMFEGKYTKENVAAYRTDLGIIDRMIQDINEEQNKGYMLPLALLRKAQLAEIIDESGHYGLPKSVEEYYKDAVAAYETHPEARSYNYVYYEYARYLADVSGDSRKNDIVTLMAHYTENVPEKQNFKTYIANIKTSGSQKVRTGLSTLEKISPIKL